MCERRQTDQKEKRNPNPQLFDGPKKQNEDDAVENRGDVTMRESEGSGERSISDGFTSLVKDRAPEMLHGTALVEAHIQHRRCAGSGKYIREDSRDGMCCVSLHCFGSSILYPFMLNRFRRAADDPEAGSGAAGPGN